MNISNVGQFSNINSSLIFDIPSVFEGNKYHALNGSLWTLPQEFRLYFLLLLISLMTGGVKKIQLAAINFLLIFLLARTPEIVPWIGSSHALLGNNEAVINSIFFLFGSIFYLFRVDRFSPKIFLIASTFFYATWFFGNRDQLLFFVAVVLFATFLAKIRLPRNLRMKNDYSYGVYLYGWPVAQILANFYPLLLPEVATLFVSIISLIVAIFSWKLIEKPAIRFSQNLLNTLEYKK
jgi:peptidoglycan/LPS O-acetylase OafA/YrhL